MIYSYVPSPLGDLLVLGDGHALTDLYLPLEGEHRYLRMPALDAVRDDDAFAVVRQQLDEYFAGSRTEFDLPTEAAGSGFQRAVWKELCEIPYGETVSYLQIARRLGMPTGSRAVGSANARNPICIIVPCHRVVAANGALSGYAGGVHNKRWLLDHEGRENHGLF